MAPEESAEVDEAMLVAFFGNLLDGFRAWRVNTPDQLRTLREQWQRRRDLAELYTYPEGYEFQLEFTDGRRFVRRTVVLLTPPDYVANQLGDGTWFRRMREEDVDGPAPYTQAWYFRRYLNFFNLPVWFLRGEHILMINEDAEPAALGVPNEPRTLAANAVGVPGNYLTARYPTPPRSLVPETRTFAIDLSPEVMPYLARHFPATVVNDLQQERRVFVTPSGHIVLRERDAEGGLQVGEVLVPKSRAHQARWREDDFEAPASYTRPDRVESNNFIPPPADRSAEIDAAEAAGGLVNIPQIPHGRGMWRFLNDAVDRPLAAALGLFTPVDVTIAIQNGGLNAGIPFNQRPQVVYTPDRRLLNPRVQPEGRGRWEYLTTGPEGSSRALAWLNFGGQEPCFPNNPRPSAQEIWELRQQYQQGMAIGMFDDDPTSSVDLVWIPTTTTPDGEDHDAIESAAAEDEADDPEVLKGESMNQEAPEGEAIDGEADEGGDHDESTHDRDVVDPESGLSHEPLNRGENNQTGTRGARHLQTRLLNGKKFTVDRARAHPGVTEPHKSWYVDKTGHWKQWKNYSSLNWNDKDRIEAMNKWREQEFSRNGWPTKRKEKRADYTDAQRKWAFDLVHSAAGERPKDRTMDSLMREFNQKFGTSRKIPGITALIDRMRKEHRKTKGKLAPRRRRGQNRMEEAARRKKQKKAAADEGSDEDTKMSDVDDDDDDEHRDATGDGGEGEHENAEDDQE